MAVCKETERWRDEVRARQEPNAEYYEIAITRGDIVLVSPDDYDLDEFRWCRTGRSRSYSAARNVNNDHLHMHRVILERMLGHEIPEGMECDHVNRDSLDNRRENLRLVSRSENLRNRRNWGKYAKGVHYDGRKKKYIALLTIGTFDTEAEAAEAWLIASKKLNGSIVRR